MGNKSSEPAKPEERSKSQPPPAVAHSKMSALTNSEANRLPDWQGPYQLYLKVTSAALTRSTDLVGKMDPFAQIEFCRPSGSNTVIKKIRGPTHKGGHK